MRADTCAPGTRALSRRSWPALAALILLLPLAAARGAEAAPAAAATLPPSRAEAAPWTVALELPSALRAGVPATATIRLAARAGHHVNLEYPAAFKPNERSTATFGGARVPLAVTASSPCPGRTGETCEVTLALPFTPGAGHTRLSGTVLFSVCTAERCLIERIALGAEAAK
jgi:hypothetical protein